MFMIGGIAEKCGVQFWRFPFIICCSHCLIQICGFIESYFWAIAHRFPAAHPQENNVECFALGRCRWCLFFFAFGWFHKSTTNCPRADFMNCFSKVGAPVLWNPMEKYHSNIIQRNSSVQGDAILEMANALHSTRTKSHPNRWCQVTSPAAKFTRLLVLCPWCHHVYLSTTQKTFTCAQLADLMMLHINSHSLRQTWTQRKNAWLWMSTGQIEPMRNIDKLYIYIRGK